MFAVWEFEKLANKWNLVGWWTIVVNFETNWEIVIQTASINLRTFKTIRDFEEKIRQNEFRILEKMLAGGSKIFLIFLRAMNID